MPKVAVCGKGGSGKTTIAGTLARLLGRQGRQTLAIDADSNPNLAITLGIPPEEAASIDPLPRTLLEQRSDEVGNPRLVLTESAEDIVQRYSVRAPDGVRLLLMSRVDHAGTGCMCRTHATVRSLLGALVEAVAQTTVADMEAGLEHLSRGTSRHADTILTVVEPYFKSLETGRKICELARELGVPKVYVVANKVQGSLEESAIRAFCERHELDLVAAVRYEEAFAEADRLGRAPLDIAPDAPGVQEIARIAERLSRSGDGERRRG